MAETYARDVCQSSKKQSRIYTKTSNDTSGENNKNDDDVYSEPESDGVYTDRILEINYIEHAMTALQLSVSEVLKRPHSRSWKRVLKEEMESHIRYNTWELMELPQGEKYHRKQDHTQE